MQCNTLNIKFKYRISHNKYNRREKGNKIDLKFHMDLLCVKNDIVTEK